MAQRHNIWHTPTVHGELPCVRRRHTVIVYNNEMYVFGGYGNNNTYMNDIYKLNFTSFFWEKVIPSSKEVPKPRCGHTAVLHGHQMYIFGGNQIPAHKFNDTWKFNLETKCWKKLETKGHQPCERHFHSACVDKYEAKMYIFGGYDHVRGFNDLYALDLEKNVWKRISQYGNIPQEDYCTSLESVDIYLYLIGGFSDIVQGQSTIRQFNTKTQIWKLLSVTNPITPPRANHKTFVKNLKLYMFGGFNDDHNRHFADLQYFDIEKKKWNKVLAIGETPIARTKHTIACNGERIIVFAGIKEGFFNNQNDIQVFDFGVRDGIIENQNWKKTNFIDVYIEFQ